MQASEVTKGVRWLAPTTNTTRTSAGLAHGTFCTNHARRGTRALVERRLLAGGSGREIRAAGLRAARLKSVKAGEEVLLLRYD